MAIFHLVQLLWTKTKLDVQIYTLKMKNLQDVAGETHHDQVDKGDCVEPNTPEVHESKHGQDDSSHSKEDVDTSKDVYSHKNNRDQEHSSQTDTETIDCATLNCEILFVVHVEDPAKTSNFILAN